MGLVRGKILSGFFILSHQKCTYTFSIFSMRHGRTASTRNMRISLYFMADPHFRSVPPCIYAYIHCICARPPIESGPGSPDPPPPPPDSYYLLWQRTFILRHTRLLRQRPRRPALSRVAPLAAVASIVIELPVRHSATAASHHQPNNAHESGCPRVSCTVKGDEFAPSHVPISCAAATTGPRPTSRPRSRRRSPRRSTPKPRTTAGRACREEAAKEALARRAGAQEVA